jgi:hypothetical protein
MRLLKVCLLLGVLSAPCAAVGQQATESMAPHAGEAATRIPGSKSELVDKIIEREREEVAAIQRQSPIVQTYLQEVKLDTDLGTIPIHDKYYLGYASLSKGIIDNSMIPESIWPNKELFTERYNAPAFLQMVYVDLNISKFNKQNYDFEFVGMEFLSEVRCYVFDLSPKPKSGKGRFKGRIWVDDQDLAIIRFNGTYTPIETQHVMPTLAGHFDSWRANVQPGLWLPFYIYCQELNLKYAFGNHVRFKAETRLWGYNVSHTHRESEFTKMVVEGAADGATSTADLTPVEAKRQWESQAEENVKEGLERAGLLAPPGPVDDVMNTVVNNIEVSNNLDVDFKCRVSTVSTFELFTIGRMIVVSRGLLDVLPDEATLAAILSQGVADGLVPNPLLDQYGFSDFARVDPIDALRRYSFKEKQEDVKLSNAKALQLLENSPYKNHLQNAALFLKQLQTESRSLTALISPRLGNCFYIGSNLALSSPAIDVKQLNQIPALAVGGRIKMNPWDDSMDLLKGRNVVLYSAREKMPFAVTPLLPTITRYKQREDAENRVEVSSPGASQAQ